MRLFLSSFRLGPAVDELFALLRGTVGGPVAVVGNALDARPHQERARAVARDRAMLQALGFAPMEVDLRGGAQAQELKRFPLVWVADGNVFVLRAALAYSGADRVLAELLDQDALVYAANGAGASVLAPDLTDLACRDDPAEAVRLYGVPALRHGLGVLDYPVLTNVDSPGHPAAAPLAALSARLHTESRPHVPLHDGQTLITDGPTTRIV